MLSPKVAPLRLGPACPPRGHINRLPKSTAYLALMAPPCLDDFTVLRCLGEGSSGAVYLVREHDSGALYALKAIPKRKMCGTLLAIETVMTERNMLLDLRGDDFVLQQCACFHDSENYYLLTEYHPAGDLHTLLATKGQDRMWFGSIWRNSCLVALERIHAKRIIHRDIKPENLFVDSGGHIVLGDFGLARKLGAGENAVSGNEMFGTPAYTPPEVFTGKPYGCEVDIWAFGVMLYELSTGMEAFKSNTVPQTDPTWLSHLARHVLHGELQDSPYLTPEVADLVSKLLRKEPETRLRNFDEIKRHPYFSEINWHVLATRSVTPPWVPCIVRDISAECDFIFEFPMLKAGRPYGRESDPISGLSFRFAPTSMTHACQRRQYLLYSLRGDLPAVHWVEGNFEPKAAEPSYASSSTSEESHERVSEVGAFLADAAQWQSLQGPAVRGKSSRRPLKRWAKGVFGRRPDAV
ncbi:kinase-like domain-containing protein [Gloeopeniophorella convolvens]|nr:kinase-like domain-containing protein [Gloeopeniophorella convolvens]